MFDLSLKQKLFITALHYWNIEGQYSIYMFLCVFDHDSWVTSKPEDLTSNSNNPDLTRVC